jgi:hypothetical protein
MATDPNVPQEGAIVKVSPEIETLVTQAMPDATNEVKQETMQLIEAIKTKAQSEAQKAGDLTRETYLEAVRNAREQVESLNLFDRDRIEESIKLVQQEVEKDWDALAKQVTSLGDRLNEAAKAAWEVLTKSRSDHSDS